MLENMNWKDVGKELPDERHQHCQLLAKIDHNCGYMVVRWDNNNKRFLPESYYDQNIAGQLITGISDWVEIDSEEIKNGKTKILLHGNICNVHCVSSGGARTHHVKKPEIGTGNVAIASCGVKSSDVPDMKGTSYIGLVNCPECMDKWQKEQAGRSQKMCSFCSTLLRDEDYNINDYYFGK